MTSCCITMETLKLIKIPPAHHFLPCQPAPHLASSNAQLTLNLDPLYVYTVKAGQWILNLIIMSEDATIFSRTLILLPLSVQVMNIYSHSSLLQLQLVGSKHPFTFYSRSAVSQGSAIKQDQVWPVLCVGSDIDDKVNTVRPYLSTPSHHSTVMILHQPFHQHCS